MPATRRNVNATLFVPENFDTIKSYTQQVEQANLEALKDFDFDYITENYFNPFSRQSNDDQICEELASESKSS